MRIGTRRACAAGVGAALVAAAVVAASVSVATGAGTTNGDPVTFGKVNCQASVGAIHGRRACSDARQHFAARFGRADA